MKTEYFENFISSLSHVEFIALMLRNIYTGEQSYTGRVVTGGELDKYSSSAISSLKHNSRLLEDETSSNIQDCCKNPLFLITHYLDRIVEEQLVFITQTEECSNEELVKQYLFSDSLTKQISALNYINIENGACIDPALDYVAVSFDYLNNYLMLLYKKFIKINIDIIPLCIERDIHLYKMDINNQEDFKYVDITIDINKDSEIHLPKELTTPKAKGLLDKAIEYNLLEDGYKWNSNLITKKELAYLCYVLSNKLELSSLLNKTDEGRYKTNWKPFKELFNVYDLNNHLRGITTEFTLTETMERIKEIYNF